MITGQLGVVVVDDGAMLHNNHPVIGVVEAEEDVLFVDNLRVRGVSIVEDVTMYNGQPVIGVVMIEDGRELYNNQRVTPVFIIE